MKLTFEDKLEIYRLLKEEGVGCKRLAKKFSITYSNARYIFHLIDLYGPEIVRHGKNRKYYKEFKEAAIKRALAGEELIVSSRLIWAFQILEHYLPGLNPIKKMVIL